jgi:hypothetical protein
MLVQFKHILMVTLATMILASNVASAQSIKGDPVDLKFEVINATTGGAGSIERLQLQYSGTHLSPIFDIQPADSQFDVVAVPVLEIGKYVMTAWSGGVPYYWSLRGRNLLESPVQLHIFDTKTGIEDAAITGLNLMIRKTESLLQLEYMLQLENTARPQVSLVGDPHVMINLPDGVKTATFIYGNGPTPEEVQLTGLSGGMVALQAPLTSGRNVMRLKTTLPWQEGRNIPVGANVEIQSWSLMATPENLDIQAFDLETTDESEVKGYLRLKGPAVAADDPFSFRIASSAGGGTEEDLFSQTSNDAQESDTKTTEPANDKNEDDKGFPFVVLTPIFVVILVIVASKRRRS